MSDESAEEHNTLDKQLAKLAPNERAALSDLVERLRERYGDDLVRVVLFGSKARGDSNEESDVDVLIVTDVPEAEYSEHRRTIINWTVDLMLNYGPVISPLIYDKTAYIQLRESDLLLSQNLERDGIELWTSTPNVPTFA